MNNVVLHDEIQAFVNLQGNLLNVNLNSDIMGEGESNDKFDDDNNRHEKNLNTEVANEISCILSPSEKCDC